MQGRYIARHEIGLQRFSDELGKQLRLDELPASDLLEGWECKATKNEPERNGRIAQPHPCKAGSLCRSQQRSWEILLVRALAERVG